MSEFGSERPVNTTRLWSGGLATAVVAALVILAGALIFRGVFGIPVLAPEEAGNLGDASTVVYALMAGVAALLATALMHLLLLSAPKAQTFFGWIVGLATAIATVTPFSQGAELSSQIATAVINLVAGIAIATLLKSVGRTSTLSAPAARRAREAREAQTVQGSEAEVRPIGEPAPPPEPTPTQEPVEPERPIQGQEPALRQEGVLPAVKQEEFRREQVRAQEEDAEVERATQEQDPKAR